MRAKMNNFSQTKIQDRVSSTNKYHKNQQQGSNIANDMSSNKQKKNPKEKLRLQECQNKQESMDDLPPGLEDSDDETESNIRQEHKKILQDKVMFQGKIDTESKDAKDFNGQRDKNSSGGTRDSTTNMSENLEKNYLLNMRLSLPSNISESDDSTDSPKGKQIQKSKDLLINQSTQNQKQNKKNLIEENNNKRMQSSIKSNSSMQSKVKDKNKYQSSLGKSVQSNKNQDFQLQKSEETKNFREERKSTRVSKVSLIERSKQNSVSKTSEAELSELDEEIEEQYYQKPQQQNTKKKQLNFKQQNSNVSKSMNNSVVKTSNQKQSTSSDIFSYIDIINQGISSSNKQYEKIPVLIKSQNEMQLQIEKLEEEFQRSEKQILQQENQLLFKHQMGKKNYPSLSFMNNFDDHEQDDQENSMQQHQQEQAILLYKDLQNAEFEVQEQKKKNLAQFQEIISSKKKILRLMAKNQKLIEEQNKLIKQSQKMGKILLEFNQIIQVELEKLKESNKPVAELTESQLSKDQEANLISKNNISATATVEEETRRSNNSNQNNNNSNDQEIIELKQEIESYKNEIHILQSKADENQQFMERIMQDAEDAKRFLKNQFKQIHSEKELLDQQKSDFKRQYHDFQRQNNDLQQQLLIHQIAKDIQIQQEYNNQFQNNVNTFNSNKYEELLNLKLSDSQEILTKQYQSYSSNNKSSKEQNKTQKNEIQIQQPSQNILKPNNSDNLAEKGYSSIQIKKKQQQNSPSKSQNLKQASQRKESNLQLEEEEEEEEGNNFNIPSSFLEQNQTLEKSNALSAIKNLIVQVQSEHRTVVKDIIYLQQSTPTMITTIKK